MANESQMINQQMRQTRADLNEKLQTLERQVAGTIDDVSRTVDSVREAVQDTVQNVRGSVTEGVQAVKDTFDIERQTQCHPWAMLGGSIALGYFGGCLLSKTKSSHPNGRREYSVVQTNGLTEPCRGVSAQETRGFSTEQKESDGWLEKLGEKFETEINELKGLAIGSSLAVLRDVIAESVPPQLGPKVVELIDHITVKLGGDPIQGPLLTPPHSERH
jgi:ElaB/YqjD/DUF883 family membrane-anchored ribosome-binding protein